VTDREPGLDRPSEPSEPSEPPRLPPRRRNPLHRTARRIAIGIVGFAVIVAGVLLSLPGIPGPGVLIVLAGLGILATEFEWAERWLERAKAKFDAAARRAGVDPKRAAVGALLFFGLLTLAAAVVWFVLR
jgi:uncharacterized protein (TIGR02611 family)